MLRHPPTRFTMRSGTRGPEATQLLALLQSAAFMPAFRRGVRNARPDLRVDELEPLAISGDGAEALRDAFSELPHDRTSGARKALHYLQHGGSADTFVAGARRQLARNGRRAHDYKFTEAALGEPRGDGARRVAGPDSGGLDGILHRARNGAEPRFSKGAAVAWLGGAASPQVAPGRLSGPFGTTRGVFRRCAGPMPAGRSTRRRARPLETAPVARRAARPRD